MNYFEDGLRGGLLKKLHYFEDVHSEFYRNAHELFPDDIVYPGMTVLDAIACFNYEDSIAVEILSTLEERGILQRNDFHRTLLSKTLFFGEERMQERFNSLVEMNPDALFEEIDEADKYAYDIVHGADEFYDMFGDWTPALILVFAAYTPFHFQVVLQATLNAFPRDLGLLLRHAKDDCKLHHREQGRSVLSYANQ